MREHTALQITINVSMDRNEDGAADIDVVAWEFDVHPPGCFADLSSGDRAAFWSKLRDEIDEFWFSAALEDHWEASWNRRLEDVNLD